MPLHYCIMQFFSSILVYNHKMSKEKACVSPAFEAGEAEKPGEPEKLNDHGAKVDLYEDNDNEYVMDEVEYEQEDVSEEEEEEEDEEEEVEEEVYEEADNADVVEAEKSFFGSDSKVVDDDESKKHAELLALPPQGSDVYVGGFPQDTSEEDLRCFCDSIGEVTEVRIMKGKGGENKGYAFVTFRNVELASMAIEKLNNTEMKGKRIRCSTSQAKHRLYISNLPDSWDAEDLKEAVSELGPGVTSVELDLKNTSNHKRVAFIEYYNHACAEYSRQKMMDPMFKLENKVPTVSWADSENTESSAPQGRAVYVKNLPENVTQDQLKNLFQHHGNITKIVLPTARPGQEKNRIGFVHFSERSSVVEAIKSTNTYELDGRVLECSLARPQAEHKPVAGSTPQMSHLLPSYASPVNFGLAGGAYGAGFGTSCYSQPMTYGRGPSPAGMTMMPMLLPDGRVGYVLQQAGVQPFTSPPPQFTSRGSTGGNSVGRGAKRGGGSLTWRRGGNDSSQGYRHRPY